MRPETTEWVAKAEADFASMLREASVAESPNHDLVCFLAQQSAEKFLKALLSEDAVAFPKTHDLNKLAALLSTARCAPAQFTQSLSRLDRYSVEFRYPGSSATSDLAADSARVRANSAIGRETLWGSSRDVYECTHLALEGRPARARRGQGTAVATDHENATRFPRGLLDLRSGVERKWQLRRLPGAHWIR
ncbi:hypothetical protein BH20VER3_BH20VER3_20250 [soil metagenome]